MTLLYVCGVIEKALSDNQPPINGERSAKDWLWCMSAAFIEKYREIQKKLSGPDELTADPGIKKECNRF
jgi:hypothetical protein